jgi:methylglutaconyl-CoA hydratase
MSSGVILEMRDDGVATVTLNRPEVRNAFDEHLIAELTGLFQQLDQDGQVRVVVLAGNGKSFSAGADLNWMRRTAAYSKQENIKDALRLASMMRAVDKLSKPTVARVHGAAFGGGVGLIACCDIAIAAESAVFSFSEVRLGLLPAAIGPYALAAIGARNARRYFLSSERFCAEEAKRIGLVHEVVAAEELDA